MNCKEMGKTSERVLKVKKNVNEKEKQAFKVKKVDETN